MEDDKLTVTDNWSCIARGASITFILWATDSCSGNAESVVDFRSTKIQKCSEIQKHVQPKSGSQQFTVGVSLVHNIKQSRVPVVHSWFPIINLCHNNI